MNIKWKELWDANPDIFSVSGWEECPEEVRKGWHLPSQFDYFSAGDISFRVGIIAAQGVYREEDFLLGGILWGGHLGNGSRTLIYYVAKEFSPVFLGAVSQIGGMLFARTVFWREKLTPNLYVLAEKDYDKGFFRLDTGELRPGWEHWQRELNPVAWNHLTVINHYFESLAKRRVRAVSEKNKITYCWGNIQIAEFKKKGNKFELSTKVKWTRNKNIASKFLKLGWVDFSGNLNDEFCRAINGILELLENMEINGSLDSRELLDLKIIYDREFIPQYFGKYLEVPWYPRDFSDLIESRQLYFFQRDQSIRIIKPVLEKPSLKVVQTLLVFSAFENYTKHHQGFPGYPQLEWNHKIFLFCEADYMEELRLCQSWLKQPDNYPLIIMPKEWRTEGFKGVKDNFIAFGMDA